MLQAAYHMGIIGSNLLLTTALQNQKPRLKRLGF